MQLEIRGHHLPGRTWQVDDRPCTNVHVGIQVGRDAVDLVPGDSASAAWSIDLEVVATADGVDFRGPAVQGRRGERFVYLTWGDVAGDGTFTMFRRAKLMLADLEALVMSDHVSAVVDLTDERGGPRCARLRPPALELLVD